MGTQGLHSTNWTSDKLIVTSDLGIGQAAQKVFQNWALWFQITVFILFNALRALHFKKGGHYLEP